MRPTVDFRRSSYKLQSSVSAADKLREHRTGAEYVSDNLVWISGTVKRKMWRDYLMKT